MSTQEDDREVEQRMAVARSADALEALGQVVASWIVPFIEKWRHTGSQPIPGPEDLSEIRAHVDNLVNSPVVPLPSGYEWLPDLLRQLAPSIRFNGRNFVNIHPNPYVPSIAASALVALQNPKPAQPEPNRVK
jgi:hypothetical protein